MDTLPDYQLIRSARRTMAIEVRPGGLVVVRVPRRVSDAQARSFVWQHRERLARHIAQMRALPRPDALTPAQISALRQQAQALLPGRVAYWAARLGVQPAGVRVTSAQKRFGSCSAKGRLCFSYLLMRYPEAAVDYVVLHEVAHLKHLNHGKAFYALIAQHMPDWQARRQLLHQPPDTHKEAG
ncbi:MAG: M48 family metallopeptidase [Clostridiales bacterium]|nr:M48 family metallopeptidase [Clostridiales bacterium]